MAETPEMRLTRSAARSLGGSGSSSGSRNSARLKLTHTEPRRGPISKPNSRSERKTRANSTSKVKADTSVTPKSQSGTQSSSAVKTCTNTDRKSVSPPAIQIESMTPQTSLKRPHSPDIEKTEEPDSKRHTTRERQSKRRSSFVRGRINKPLSALTSTEISARIPADLSNEERLSSLTKECLEYTMQKLAEEFPDLEGVHKFEVQARESVAELMLKLQSRETFKHACNKESRCQPNPVNIEIDQAAAEYQAHIDRLQTEDATWTQLTKEREEGMKHMEQQARDLSLPSECPGSLTRQQRHLLDGGLNYDEMLQNLRNIRDRTQLQVDEVMRMAHYQNEFQNAAQTFYREQAQLLGVKTFERVEQLQDARILLQHAAAATTPKL